MTSPQEPKHLADQIAPDVAASLEAVDACTDPELLRAAFRILVTAVPELPITTAPVDAILATVGQATESTWP